MFKPRPDLKGNMTFIVGRGEFLYYAGITKINTYYKKMMKEFGYVIRPKGKYIEVTRLFLNMNTT